MQRIAQRETLKKKGLAALNLLTLICIGRCDRIRTYDPLHPMQVRYRAAPHTEAIYSSSASLVVHGLGHGAAHFVERFPDAYRLCSQSL